MDFKWELTDTMRSRLSFYGLVLGIVGLVFCCNPPVQLVTGAAAVILSWLSGSGRSISGQSKAGLILGIISIVLSLLMFLYVMLAFQIMSDPENASLIREVYEQYQNIISGMAPAAGQ